MHILTATNITKFNKKSMAYERFSREINPGWDDRLRKYVSINRLSYKELMTSLQISRGTVSNLLNGKHKPSSDVVSKIERVYSDLDINWLLYGDGNQPQKSNSVTQSVTSNSYKSGVTEYNTTAFQPPPPPPPPPPGSADEEVIMLNERYREIIDNQSKTIAFLQQHVNQLTEQNKSIMELFKMGKFDAVTFTGPQEYPLYTFNNGNSVTLAVTAERKVA